MQRWYKKVSIQVAIITGFFSIVIAIIGVFKYRETTIIIPVPQNSIQQGDDTRSRKDGSPVENNHHSSQSISPKDDLQKHRSELFLLNELRNKLLKEKLIDAKNYLISGNIENKEKSIQLYREIIDKLSSEAKAELDQKLLIEANSAYMKSQNDDAARKYSALFSNYYNK